MLPSCQRHKLHNVEFIFYRKDKYFVQCPIPVSPLDSQTLIYPILKFFLVSLNTNHSISSWGGKFISGKFIFISIYLQELYNNNIQGVPRKLFFLNAYFSLNIWAILVKLELAQYNYIAIS